MPICDVMPLSLFRNIESASILTLPELPNPSLPVVIKAPSVTLNCEVLIVTSPELPLGTGGSLNNCCKDGSRILAEEIIKLGLREPGTVPLTSTESAALMVTLPALPVAVVEASTLPPSRTTNR